MKRRPLTELTSCLVTIILRDNVFHIPRLDLDSRTGQGGRGGVGLEKLPGRPRSGDLPAFCLAWRWNELLGTDWGKPSSVFLVVSVGQPRGPPSPQRQVWEAGAPVTPGPCVCVSAVGSGRCWELSDSLCAGCSVQCLPAGSPGFPPSQAAGLRGPATPRREPGGGCGPFMTSAAFSGRSLRIWGHV